MRILVLNHEYPPIGGGGGKACQDIAEELTSRGHELVILTSHFEGLSKIEANKNLKLIRIPTSRRKLTRAGIGTMGIYIIRAVFSALRIIHNWKPELIHVHFAVPAGAAAYLLHRLTGIQYVLTTHLGDIPGGSPQKTKKWFQIIFPWTKPIWSNASKITTVSVFTATLANKYYGMTPIVIPNGIIVRESREITPHAPPLILFAGRFVVQKNLDIFLDVLESIRDLSWKCVMLGDGPLQNQISSRIERSGLRERFQLPGWVDPEKVLNAMDQGDILFMPSLSEGLPVVGVQALESGLAMVASNVGGFVDLIEQEKNGFLCSPLDKKSMQEGLVKLLTDQGTLLQFRKYSRELVKKFNIQKVVDQYESLFEELIIGRHISEDQH